MEDTTIHLIRNCRKGIRSSQLEIYQRYAKKIYHVCLRIVGNSPEAEEAMQDTFLKVFTRLESYREEINFEAWMHRIAIHTAIDYVRRQETETIIIDENFPEPEDEEMAEDEVTYTVEEIKKATTLLAAGYRIILSLYLFEGYDMEEISSILEIKPASVRSQYLRAKRKLIELISLNGTWTD